MFSQDDLQQIARHGLSPESVGRQIEHFRRGFPYLKVVRAASPGDGVTILDDGQADRAAARYDEAAGRLSVVKFVPASGAATRMFKELFEFVNEDKRGKGIDTLLQNIERFAFWPELKAVLPAGADERAVVAAIVGEGLAYGSKPKGLVTFHAYPDGARKAVEEHLVEGAAYAASGGVARIHFTVSPEHRAGFEALLAEKIPVYEKRFGIRYDISFSVQKSSTDTIAVNPDNTPFRCDDGSLLFRPAGHGALIENLNEIDADLIFIKNIDNVTTDAQRGDTVRFKKVLAGVLLDLQARAFAYLKALDEGAADLGAIAEFIRRELCVALPERYDAALLRAVLDRPIRVCGMDLSGRPIPTAPSRSRSQSRVRLHPAICRSCSGPPTSIRSISCAACAMRRAESSMCASIPIQPRGSFRRNLPVDANCAPRSCPGFGTVPWRAGTPSSSMCRSPRSRPSRSCRICCGPSISRGLNSFSFVRAEESSARFFCAGGVSGTAVHSRVPRFSAAGRSVCRFLMPGRCRL